MLRATHFVLLFVIFACAHAAPADDAGTVIASAPVPGPLGSVLSDDPHPLSKSGQLLDKNDLETAANAHRGHHHHGGGRYWGHHWGGRGGHHWGGRGGHHWG